MASTYLTRTNTGTVTNNKIFTFSAWIKRSTISTTQNSIFASYPSGTSNDLLYMPTADTLGFWGAISGSQSVFYLTNRVLRDVSAWYHIVLAVDTTQATASDRVKIYINGVQETSFSQSSAPAQNTEFRLAKASNPQEIGSQNGGSTFDGLMSHVHFVDGTAYTPSAFGSTDNVTGQWKINTSPSVNYGTNGFFILKDGNSVTDQSGNSNNFTVGGGTLIKTEDCPSNNFATLNPLQGNLTLTNGNTSATTSSYQYALSTIGMNSGKYYFEMKVTHGCMVMGIQDFNKAQDRLFGSGTFWYSGSQSYHLDGFSRFSHDSYGDISSDATAYPTYGNNDIIMMAVDLDNNKLAYGKNGYWYNSTNPSSGTTNMVSIDAPSTLSSGFYGFVAADTCSASDGTFYVNFGSGFFGSQAITTNSGAGYAGADGASKFQYQPPTNYRALNTKGLNT